MSGSGSGSASDVELSSGSEVVLKDDEVCQPKETEVLMQAAKDADESPKWLPTRARDLDSREDAMIVRMWISLLLL